MALHRGTEFYPSSPEQRGPGRNLPGTGGGLCPGGSSALKPGSGLPPGLGLLVRFKVPEKALTGFSWVVAVFLTPRPGGPPPGARCARSPRVVHGFLLFGFSKTKIPPPPKKKGP